MNDCKHEWRVVSIADVDERHMETEGYFNLECVQCGAHATLQRPTYLECYQVTKTWLEGGDPCFTGDDDRLVVLDDGPVLIEYPNDGDLYADGDDNVTDVGTMGWLPGEDDQIVASGESDMMSVTLRKTGGQGDDRHTPAAECMHQWYVVSMGSGDNQIIVNCPKCIGLAEVGDVTLDDLKIVLQAWKLGMVLIWGDESRLVPVDAGQGITPSQLREQIAGFMEVFDVDQAPSTDDQTLPAVADLVNALDLFLFAGDNDDIPF